MHLRTGVGVVELKASHGQDPGDRHWGCPIRERWGLLPHQELSPALEDKLAFTVTATQTYKGAAEVSRKWGSPVSDSAVHRLTQRLGAKAEAQTQERLQAAPPEAAPQRAPCEARVLMLDGWLARFRGEGWGKRKTQKKRVEWHEIRNGLFYRLEQAGRTAGDRGVISEKLLWASAPSLGIRCVCPGLGRGQRRFSQ